MKNSANRSLKITLSIAAMLFGGQMLSMQAVACDAAGPNEVDPFGRTVSTVV